MCQECGWTGVRQVENLVKGVLTEQLVICGCGCTEHHDCDQPEQLSLIEEG